MLKIKQSPNIVLQLEDSPLSLDPIHKHSTFELNFVTHAHRDHINLTKNNNELNPTYLTTETTKEVMKALFERDFKTQELILNKKYSIDGLSYKIINAGHVLGSYSLVLEYNGTKITITSDINTRDSTTTKAAIPEDTDILIIESTYGEEKDVFPDRKAEYTRLLKWVLLNKLNNKLPIISAYTFGKTQEIVKLISDNTKLDIGLNNKAVEICDIYKKQGMHLNNYFKANGNTNEMDVLIMPPSSITKNMVAAISTTSKKGLALATVSGKGGIGEQFNISDHADVNGLLNYVKESKAKLVYTYHGKDKEFAELVNKKLGLNARPLKELVLNIN